MFDIIKNEFQDKKPFKIAVYSLKYFCNWIAGNIAKDSFILHSGYKEVKLDIPPGESFFGYYDRSPVSPDGKYCLIHWSSRSTRWNPSSDKSIKLFLYDFVCNKIIREWEILSYNWQQGCKPQWIDNNRFIFNNFDCVKSKYYSTIYDIKTGQSDFIDFPSYDSCSDYFLSLNFSRLNKYRPDYGYRNLSVGTLDDSRDGVFIHDFSEKSTELLIDIDSLKKFNPVASMDSAAHKVNHIMIAPDRTKFMFMHRWINSGVKTDRLYVYDLTTSKLSLVADNGMVSHCFWKDDSHIVGYMNGIDLQTGYYEICLIDNTIRRLPNILQNFGDGHPHILGPEMIFDTYPQGANRYKSLFSYDLINGQLEVIGRFREACGFENQCRCDLHPRIVSKDVISIDSTHFGERRFMLIQKVKSTK